jgi:hypothetical protein
MTLGIVLMKMSALTKMRMMFAVDKIPLVQILKVAMNVVALRVWHWMDKHPKNA